MKYAPDVTTSEGWGGRGNSDGYSPQSAGSQYVAGVATAPPAAIAVRKHGTARYPAGTIATGVGPYSIGTSVERVT